MICKDMKKGECLFRALFEFIKNMWRTISNKRLDKLGSSANTHGRPAPSLRWKRLKEDNNGKDLESVARPDR